MAPEKRKEPPAVDEEVLAEAVEAAKRKAQARTRTIWQEDTAVRGARALCRVAQSC